ncbi:MAG: ATP-binding protein [Methanoregulaceae archaeon]
MNQLIEQAPIGFFKGFSESGLEFKAEIVSPYHSNYRPILGSFILIFVDKQNLILGRITRFSPVGIMSGMEGDEYLADLARLKKQDIPEGLKESKLRYNVNVKLLGGLEYDYDKAGFNYRSSIRKLPHLGAPVKEPTLDIIKFICSLGSQVTKSTSVDIGYYSLGEIIFDGNNVSDTIPIQFDIDKLVSKRTFVFARAGYGKSVLIKLLVTKLYEKEQDVGMLIFDPEGEYAFPVNDNPGLANIPELANKLVVYTNRAYPNLDVKFKKMIGGSVSLNLSELKAGDVVAQCVVPEKQEMIFALRLKGLYDQEWATLIDKLYDEEYRLADEDISDIVHLDPKKDDASLRAIKNNLIPVIKSLHNKDSRMIEGIKHHLKKGHIVVVDISLLSTGVGNEICGLILNELFNQNQKNFSSGEESKMSKIIVTIEEAQTVLSQHMSDTSPFVRWAKEGRKYRLGAILVTQQPGAMAGELLSQGDNFFAFHLLSEGDLKALQRANAHFSNDILANILNEPIKGNAYFWSAPDQPFVLPVRIINFGDYAKNKNQTEFSGKTAIEEFHEQFPVLEDELVRVTRKTIEENDRIFIFSNVTLNENPVQNHYAFSYFFLRRYVAEALSNDSSNQFVETTKTGIKLVKKRDMDSTLVKLNLPTKIFKDETNYEYLLVPKETLNVKKSISLQFKLLKG